MNDVLTTNMMNETMKNGMTAASKWKISKKEMIQKKVTLLANEIDRRTLTIQLN